MAASPQFMVGIVASSAVQEIQDLLGSLPEDFPAPIVVEMPFIERFVNAFVARLNAVTRLAVVRPENGIAPEPGVVYFASDVRKLLLQRGRFHLEDGAPSFFDAMDSLFHSMAQELASGAVGVILSGFGSDGAQGMKEIRDAGGYTIAQDSGTSLVYGKPRIAVELGAVCESLPLQSIGPRLVELVSRDFRR